jgi:sRNA-binding carbon storage regulator CsrA
MPTSPIGRLVLGRDLGEAILIGDDIAVVLTMTDAGTSDKGVRLLIIAPRDLPISRTEGVMDPQELLKAAERREMQRVAPCRLDRGQLVDKPSPHGAKVRPNAERLERLQIAVATARTTPPTTDAQPIHNPQPILSGQLQQRQRDTR